MRRPLGKVSMNVTGNRLGAELLAGVNVKVNVAAAPEFTVEGEMFLVSTGGQGIATSSASFPIKVPSY